MQLRNAASETEYPQPTCIRQKGSLEDMRDKVLDSLKSGLPPASAVHEHDGGSTRTSTIFEQRPVFVMTANRTRAHLPMLAFHAVSSWSGGVSAFLDADTNNILGELCLDSWSLPLKLQHLRQ